MTPLRTISLLGLALVLGCGGASSNGTSPASGQAGSVGSVGGASATGGAIVSGGVQAGGSASGGAVQTGGASAASGASSTAGGAIGTGGTLSIGGVSSSGTTSIGGTAPTGGISSNGGSLVSGGTVATGGTRATGGGVSTGGSIATGGIVSTGGLASIGGSAGAGGCGTTCTSQAFVCCGDSCRNTDNDPLNCGSCGRVCPSNLPICQAGICTSLTCTASNCSTPSTCCGSACCAAAQLCCEVPGPIARLPSCVDPVDGTCPRGCKLCVCADPDTPIATPDGPRRIAELAVGDLVYSVEDNQTVPVPIAAVKRRAATGHIVPELTLSNGEVLRISEGHPTIDGRSFGELEVGSPIGELTVVAVKMVTYGHRFTYDIRPATQSGWYFAGGALIASTIAPPASELMCLDQSPPARDAIDP